ncbi:MAG: hypothetical protein R6X13_09575 [bacterium]
MPETSKALLALCALVGSLALAQPYKCDWSVVGTGGGEMAGAAFRAGATAGQTASGALVGSTYSALIGFWLTDLQVGIHEAADLPGPATLRAAPFATIVRGVLMGRQLTADGSRQELLDISGRRVLALKPGPNDVSHFTSGVYFVQSTIDNRNSTISKVLITR